MRKTLRTALGAALGTVLVSATMAVSATPAFADDCAAAAPLGVDAETGTLDALTSQRWWSHSIDTDRRVVSLATPGGSATLQIRDVDCSTVLCTDSASALESATCTVDAGGPILVGVIGDTPAGGPVVDQVTAFVLDVLDPVPTLCNDGLDNDRDGATDWPYDEQCTSALDNTEAPIHVAAYGHITIETDSANRPRMALSGVFADPKRFTCGLEPSPIQVTCVQVSDTEFLYVCTHFILTAKAYSTSKPLGPGSAKGHVACDSPNSLTTEDVDSSQNLERTTSEADSFHPYVQLGTAHFVRCRAMGIGGADNATGAFTVDCFEPGVAWQDDTVQDPRG